MSGEKQYEYPDEAGYPDGTGTLDEGVGHDAVAEGGAGGAGDAGTDADEADAAESELNEFAMEDEEDLDGNV
ncbi:hypothetical protein [Agromyces sp. ZXT2-3]|uniref:hypothetical protein n=1 Tax=Agromyces sp. ZXT2-3 TaxID=3461152 RepID=UPI004054F51D